MGLFGEVKGNDNASRHFGIQSMIEPEIIGIQQRHGFGLKGGNLWT
jgi:hypothetical protein